MYSFVHSMYYLVMQISINVWTFKTGFKINFGLNEIEK